MWTSPDAELATARSRETRQAMRAQRSTSPPRFRSVDLKRLVRELDEVSGLYPRTDRRRAGYSALDL
jgi:hypothetical protein